MAKELPEHGVAVQQQPVNQHPHPVPVANQYAAQRAHFGQFCRDVLADFEAQEQDRQQNMTTEQEVDDMFAHVYRFPT